MAKFTDRYIQRPVLASVISLLIFFVGLRALVQLPIQQFPTMTNTVITVQTSYRGAPAELVEGFITTQLEQAIAGAEGIDYLTSVSDDGGSTIKAYIKLNYNPDAAFTNIMAKVAQESGSLPKEADQPIILKETGSATSLMYVGFDSREMSPGQITDYISRVVRPKLETISGISQVDILGGKSFAMRIWLRPIRMASLGVTAADVTQALLANNFQTAAGKTQGEYVAFSIKVATNAETVDEFSNIVIRQSKEGALIRVKDVAKVVLGAEDYDSSVYFNGKQAVFIGINAAPEANPLSIINAVKEKFSELKMEYPPTLHSSVVYDATRFIRASIHEVKKTLLEATLIVIVVIFCFLGSLRTVFIPVVTIPLSLIGVCSLMLLLGYSLNLLTLLALVLAIGLVVDDAIVVVENCYRHMEGGLPPYEAALKGAREIAMPVITMTITLAAVYAPIGFMGGLTGSLFKEFAFTLAATVIISGIIALTLSPMMCSKILSHKLEQQTIVKVIDAAFLRFKNVYFNALTGVLKYPSVIIMFALVVLLSCYLMFITTPAELAPVEDQGVLFVQATGPQSATLNYMEKFTQSFFKIYNGIKVKENDFLVNGYNGASSAISGIMLQPWDQRKMTQAEVNNIIQQKFNQVAGLQVQAFPLPSLPTGGDGLPVQFVINSTSSFQFLYPVMQQLVNEARKSGMFMFIDGGLQFNKPQLNIEINRSKAGQLGIRMQDLGMVLASSLGGSSINWFSMSGRSYKVIPQMSESFRRNPEALNNIHIKTESGAVIPLNTITNLTYDVKPNYLTHFQQLNSTTLNGMMAPGYSLGQGLEFLQQIAQKIFPRGVTYDFAGESRQYMQEGHALTEAFLFSIMIIYLVLAAQFESFRDPLVVMTSVPMAICGALLPLNWGFGTINIYTQIGFITLIGLISKHGILMVDFANKLKLTENLSPIDAIQKAASIRLRPILMTTAAMILGVVPLILASGAGAASRFDIGLVIAMGMLIGTFFTLFVVPTMYLLKGRTILLFLVIVIGLSFLLKLLV